MRKTPHIRGRSLAYNLHAINSPAARNFPAAAPQPLRLDYPCGLDTPRILYSLRQQSCLPPWRRANIQDNRCGFSSSTAKSVSGPARKKIPLKIVPLRRLGSDSNSASQSGPSDPTPRINPIPWASTFRQRSGVGLKPSVARKSAAAHLFQLHQTRRFSAPHPPAIVPPAMADAHNPSPVLPPSAPPTTGNPSRSRNRPQTPRSKYRFAPEPLRLASSTVVHCRVRRNTSS